MKVNVRDERKKVSFNELRGGQVFIGDDGESRMYLMRTDEYDWVAVDIETGVLYSSEDFSDDEQVYLVEAEVTIKR